MRVCLRTVFLPPADPRVLRLLLVWRLVIDTEPCALPSTRELARTHLSQSP